MSNGYIIFDEKKEYEMLTLDGVQRKTGLKETEIQALMDANIMHSPITVNTQIWNPYGLYKIQPYSPEFIRMCLKGISM